MAENKGREESQLDGSDFAKIAGIKAFEREERRVRRAKSKKKRKVGYNDEKIQRAKEEARNAKRRKGTLKPAGGRERTAAWRGKVGRRWGKGRRTWRDKALGALRRCARGGCWRVSVLRIPRRRETAGKNVKDNGMCRVAHAWLRGMRPRNGTSVSHGVCHETRSLIARNHFARSLAPTASSGPFSRNRLHSATEFDAVPMPLRCNLASGCLHAGRKIRFRVFPIFPRFLSSIASDVICFAAFCSVLCRNHPSV